MLIRFKQCIIVFLIAMLVGCGGGSESAPAPEPPPIEEPPAEDPPVEDPPVEDPPVEDPPVEDPPVDDPPAEEPPTEEPPTEEPPVQKTADVAIERMQLVMVRSDGKVYRSTANSLNPVYAFALTSTDNSVVAASTDPSHVYALLDNGEVVKGNMLGRSYANIQTIGQFDNATALVAIEVRANDIYVLDSAGEVYKNFTSDVDTTLTEQDFNLDNDAFTITTVENNFSLNANGNLEHEIVGGATSNIGSVDVGDAQFVALNWLEVSAEQQPLLARQPNVIIILSDDHGFTDLGIYGIDPNVQTPALDDLATNGVYMTHGYVTAPQCVPSRAGMVTGVYNFKSGVRSNKDSGLPLHDPNGNVVRTHAQDMKDNGYVTGLVGKWHLNFNVDNPKFKGVESDYFPGSRGFDDYFYGFHKDFRANFHYATGAPVSSDEVYNHEDGFDGRTIIQGQAANTFIKQHKDEPFFLYFSPYGPHVPRLSSTYEAVQNFPLVDYPQYDDAEDQVRREGLALIKMIDDTVADIMQTLRDNNIEEDTLIMFVTDNGAQPKLWSSINPSITGWDGSENIPRRGEKGSLFEGGINVPMLAYWKGVITPGQKIDEAVLSLDFMATAMQLAAGKIPERYDGVDLLPKLTGKTNNIERPEPLYWFYGDPGKGEQAIRKGDWKLRRSSYGELLFNLVDDPNELINLLYKETEKAAELVLDLDTYIANLHPGSRVAPGVTKGDENYIYGTDDVNAIADSRYLGGEVYAKAIVSPDEPLPSVDSDGDGMLDQDEIDAGRDPDDAGDLAFEFNQVIDVYGKIEGWTSSQMTGLVSGNGKLMGVNSVGTAKIFHEDLGFSGDEVSAIEVKVRGVKDKLFRFYWSIATQEGYSSTRRHFHTFTTDDSEIINIPFAGESLWNGQTITGFRIQPVGDVTDWEIDHIRAK